jgi:hypothetical protein
VATSVAVYVVLGASPAAVAETGRGVIPAPSSWAQGNIATPAGVGESSKAQLVTCQALGLTVPTSIAVVVVMALGVPVTTAGADGVHVNVSEGCAPSAVGTREKSETPAAPAGTPEAPPPPPPPAAL